MYLAYDRESGKGLRWLKGRSGARQTTAERGARDGQKAMESRRAQLIGNCQLEELAGWAGCAELLIEVWRREGDLC